MLVVCSEPKVFFKSSQSSNILRLAYYKFIKHFDKHFMQQIVIYFPKLKTIFQFFYFNLFINRRQLFGNVKILCCKSKLNMMTRHVFTLIYVMLAPSSFKTSWNTITYTYTEKYISILSSLPLFNVYFIMKSFLWSNNMCTLDTSMEFM